MKPEDVKCPVCGGRMVRKTARATGRKFWGCLRFPECRGTRDTDGEAPRRWNEDEGEEGPGGGLPSERARGNDRRRW